MSDPANLFAETASTNLAALRQYRPELFALLGSQADTDRYRLALGPTGEPTVARVSSTGESIPCVPGGSPTKHLQDLRHHVDTDFFATLGVAGVGDGSVLALLSQLRSRLPQFEGGQPVLVLEPDLGLLVAALHLHDFSGPGGPFADPRFIWCAGPHWDRQLWRVLAEDAQVHCPNHFLLGGQPRVDIGRPLEALLEQLMAAHQDRCVEQHRRYAALDPAALADRFEGRGSAPLKVLLMTSRFTTVLQYTVEHLATGLRALGHDTRILSETAPHHRMGLVSMSKAVAEYQPDLVVVPDHLRKEYDPVFPAGLPFVCWIQDEMPSLANRSSGQSVGGRDFIWLRDPDTYRSAYEYPARQLLRATSLTVERSSPAVRSVPAQELAGDDLVYFSHSSRTLEEVQLLSLRWTKGQNLDAKLLQTLTSALIERYLNGEGVRNVFDFCQEVMPELGGHPDTTRRWMDGALVRDSEPTPPLILYSRALGDARSVLHRQQGLRWASQISKELGLRLSIYGHGWERLPEFAPHARGPADYRQALTAVSQAARINLSLEPWPVVSHWRGLDALASGAQLLARQEHYREPAFSLLAHILEAQREQYGSFPTDVSELLTRAPTETQPRILELLDLITGLPFPDADPIAALVRQLALGAPANEVRSLPGLHHITFDTPAELRTRVQWILNEPAATRSVYDRLRQEVLASYSYQTGAGKLCAFISRRLREEARTA
jgi:hypothetical protein